MNIFSHVLVALAAAVSFAASGAPASSSLVSMLQAESPAPPASATVLFGGDMMLDRSIRARGQRIGVDLLFFCVDPSLEGADAVVANLEGPITEHASRSLGSQVGAPNNYVFTFPKSTAELLYDHHVRIVNVGNNHILNFGPNGLRSTLLSLDGAGVAYFGQAAGESYVYRTTIGGVPIEFINYNEFGGDASTTITQIAGARAAGYLAVVYTHWGIEYRPSAPQYVRDLAHAFVDAGAAAVIGSHPHVVEDHETYHGAPIYYSLGNFIFDQYWNDAVRHGLLLKLSFDARGVTRVQEVPIVLSTDRTVCAQ